MEQASGGVGPLVETAKRFARRLLTIGENRFELFLVDVQEERERLLHAILLALGVAAFGLLAGMALTAVIVVLFWETARVAALLTLTFLYGAVTGLFYLRFKLFLFNWRNLSATRDQLKKDFECLEKHLE